MSGGTSGPPRKRSAVNIQIKLPCATLDAVKARYPELRERRFVFKARQPLALDTMDEAGRELVAWMGGKPPRPLKEQPAAPAATIPSAAPAAPAAPVAPTPPAAPFLTTPSAAPVAPTPPAGPFLTTPSAAPVAPTPPAAPIATTPPAAPVAPTPPVAPVAPTPPVAPVAPTPPLAPAAPTPSAAPAASWPPPPSAPLPPVEWTSVAAWPAPEPSPPSRAPREAEVVAATPADRRTFEADLPPGGAPLITPKQPIPAVPPASRRPAPPPPPRPAPERAPQPPPAPPPPPAPREAEVVVATPADPRSFDADLPPGGAPLITPKQPIPVVAPASRRPAPPPMPRQTLAPAASQAAQPTLVDDTAPAPRAPGAKKGRIIGIDLGTTNSAAAELVVPRSMPMMRPFFAPGARGAGAVSSTNVGWAACDAAGARVWRGIGGGAGRRDAG